MQKSSLVAAALAGVLSTSVSASPYSDYYVFGDSLLDAGNISEGLRFTNRVGPDYRDSPYGPVSPMLVADALGLDASVPSEQGGTNYAVGGHKSADTLASITAATTYDAPAGTFNSFFYDLDRQGRDLDRRAVYVLDGGGNDLPAFVPNDVVASNMVAAATALQERGARSVVLINVPDFGLAPAGILFQDFASAAALDINNKIREQVGSASILIFDSYALIQEVVADPMAFGVGVTSEQFSYSSFDDAGCGTCIQGDPTAKIDGSNPDPDKFFFNDTRHPTVIGQQIVADYLLSVLIAPGEIAMGSIEMAAVVPLR